MSHSSKGLIEEMTTLSQQLAAVLAALCSVPGVMEQGLFIGNAQTGAVSL
jgi:hypothetical protein